MATKKIAVSLPEKTLRRARSAVRDGKAPSVSGYIAQLIDEASASETHEALFEDLRRSAGIGDDEWDTARQRAEDDLRSSGLFRGSSHETTRRRTG